MKRDLAPNRRYDLDWLRVIAFGILMLFHTGMGFTSFPWHVKNYESSRLIDELVRFLHQWRMPLLFFISGACGLLYELVWIRTAGTIIGNTTYAVGTVVAVFMGGLALGGRGAGEPAAQLPGGPPRP